MIFCMPIRLKFPPHMQDRIQDRSIDADHVRKAINNPDFTKSVFEGRILVKKKLEDGRTIKVIYFKDGFRDVNDRVIITALYI